MKSISQADLVYFVNLSSQSDYNEERKERYRKLGKEILKQLAEIMKLEKGSFDIRWNPGGIACSGDHTLHAEWFYLALHDNLGAGWFYYRTCKGRNDYSGGPNILYAWTKLTAFGIEHLAHDIQSNCKSHPPIEIEDNVKVHELSVFQ